MLEGKGGQGDEEVLIITEEVVVRDEEEVEGE